MTVESQKTRDIEQYKTAGQLEISVSLTAKFEAVISARGPDEAKSEFIERFLAGHEEALLESIESALLKLGGNVQAGAGPICWVKVKMMGQPDVHQSPVKVDLIPTSIVMESLPRDVAPRLPGF